MSTLRGEPFCKKVPPRTPFQKLPYPVRCVAPASSGSHTASEQWSLYKVGQMEAFCTTKFPPYAPSLKASSYKELRGAWKMQKRSAIQDREPSEESTILLEAAGGFEPPYNGFADRRLTTWLSRPKFGGHSSAVQDPLSRLGHTVPLFLRAREFAYHFFGCGMVSGGTRVLHE
jgi:hypothetical protein